MLRLNYFDVERVIHGVKTALACLIGYAITESVHFHVDQWLIITVLVVMCAQLNIGSVIQKSYMRFIGTFIGSLISILTLELFGTGSIAIALVVGGSALVFSYIATGQKSFSDAGTLGAVTVIIILIAKNPTLISATERFVEISIGILIAALVSQFVLPLHAYVHLRKLQAATLRQLSDFYRDTLISDETEFTKEHYQLLDENIAQSLIKQRKLATDASRELLGNEFNLQQFNKMLYAEKEILRSIAMMRYISIASVGSRNLLAQMPLLQDFHAAIRQALEEIALSVETNNSNPDSITLPNMLQLKEQILLNARLLTAESISLLNAYLFSAQLLVSQLQKIMDLRKDAPLLAPASPT